MLNFYFYDTDYKDGFGGKYGVQNDRQDKSAVGWDHQETVQKHESQKGKGYQVYHIDKKDQRSINLFQRPVIQYPKSFFRL